MNFLCYYPSTNSTLPPFRPVTIDVVGGLSAVMGGESETVRQVAADINIYK